MRLVIQLAKLQSSVFRVNETFTVTDNRMRTILIYALVCVALANEIYGQATPDRRKRICEPGNQTKVGRDVCTCSADGTKFSCERIPDKYLNPDGSIRRPGGDNPLLRGKRDQICKPGSVRKWNCNTCRCSKDGTREACSRMACPELTRQRRDLDTKCTPRSTFMNDCNRCWCSDDGETVACTLMACPPLPLLNGPTDHNKDHLLRTKRDQVCEPGRTRFQDCNSCRCSADGKAEWCTRKGCPTVPRTKREAPLQCTPNERFNIECNSCICSRDGRAAACTAMACV